ncbi:integrase arm-type DNA-binding domain-containing protein [Alphaproteobacteria bacterium]|nr:integrase arm-type DNA-binding domain-containing protein [Alphaproteobacteria bacterium]
MLTDRTVRDAKPKKNVYRLRDANIVCRGFGAAIAPSGAKTFFLAYTSPEDGKRKQIAIGRFPAMSLKEARFNAGKLREEVNNGKDPAVEKQRALGERINQRSLGTLEDLLDLYIADLETDAKRAATEVKRIRSKDIPSTLLSRPAHLISKDDILDILTPIAQRGAPVHSDHVRAYLRAAFELGLHAESMTRWRGRAVKFNLQHNPVAAVKKTVTRKIKGNRALSRDEIMRLWNTDQLTPPMLLALKVLLATGQRVEEVLHATWDELDANQMVWIIPGERRKTRGKTSEPHIVPLTAFHLQLLEQIRDETAHTRFLFPSTDGETPRRYDSLTNAVRKYVGLSGMNSFSPRDLRRTFKTVAGSLGISLEMRNRLQGHAMTDVGSVHYDRYDYLTEKRAAMAAWASGLAAIVGGTK